MSQYHDFDLVDYKVIIHYYQDFDEQFIHFAYRFFYLTNYSYHKIQDILRNIKIEYNFSFIYGILSKSKES
jgi:hypothetical protein